MLNDPDEPQNDEQRLAYIREERKKLGDEIDCIKKELRAVEDEMAEAGFIRNGKPQAPRVRVMEIGMIKFQKKPKDGIHYMTENKLVENSAEAVAKFLYEENFDKRAKGEYLGDIKNEFCSEVLTHYIQLFDFKDKDFVECLREFFSTFLLPGEGQKIDDILNKWGTHYYESNETLLNNADEAYVLAFAVLLLNTSLHNTTAAKLSISFTEESGFVGDMMQYENTDFKEEFLRKIYYTIRDFPLLNLINPVVNAELSKKAKLKGKLWYQSSNLKQWQQRQFLLITEQLIILHENNKDIRYKINIENTKLNKDFNNTRKFVLTLTPDSSKTDSIIILKSAKNNTEEEKQVRSFTFACNNDKEMSEWESTINYEIDKINEATRQI